MKSGPRHGSPCVPTQMQDVIDGIQVRREGGGSPGPRPRLWGRRLFLAARFLLLLGFWLVLSGMYDPFHVGLGVASSAFVTWLSADFFPPEAVAFRRPRAVLAFCLYIPWLLWKMLAANLAMLRLVFHPRMYALLDPRKVQFRTKLRSRLGLTVLANSITLTPGTITVAIDKRGYVTVHAIDRASAEGLPGRMEDKVARIFEEA